MKRYTVRFEPEARVDLDDIYFWIAEHGGVAVADRFTERLRTYCESLDVFPMRGSALDYAKPGARTVTFEQSVQIAFVVGDGRVDILRMTYRGRAVETLLR